MIKKIIIGIALIPVLLYFALWIFAKTLHASSDSREWPLNLGVLADAPNRYPDAEDNAAATTLAKLTPWIGISVTPSERKSGTLGYEQVKKPLADYLTAQLERSSDQSAAPPLEVGAFFAAHGAQIDQIRDHVATAGPIQWRLHFREGFEAPIPNLLGYMSLSKVFTARALAKAANHDATAWDDLHAVWLLDREMWNRPELISQLIALAGTRMVNGAAVKMPLPEPAWLNEIRGRDYRRDFARTFQAESSNWRITFENDLHKHTLKNLLWYPYADACLVDGAEQMRVETIRMSKQTDADVSKVQPITIKRWNIISGIAFPNLTGAWQRLYRFEAEREATDKALALRRGETPSTASSFTDGKWIVGANSVKFNRAIPVSVGTKYPLEYAVTR